MNEEIKDLTFLCNKCGYIFQSGKFTIKSGTGINVCRYCGSLDTDIHPELENDAHESDLGEILREFIPPKGVSKAYTAEGYLQLLYKKLNDIDKRLQKLESWQSDEETRQMDRAEREE